MEWWGVDVARYLTSRLDADCCISVCFNRLECVLFLTGFLSPSMPGILFILTFRMTAIQVQGLICLSLAAICHDGPGFLRRYHLD